VSQRARRGADSGKVLVQLTSDDFSRNDDGSWTVVRDVFITGSTESQLLIKEGKVFKKAEMMLFGMDLAAILERHRQP
jgi:hypothetical protein